MAKGKLLFITLTITSAYRFSAVSYTPFSTSSLIKPKFDEQQHLLDVLEYPKSKSSMKPYNLGMMTY